MAIQKIQQETINEMEAKSAANIPDRPYDYGYSATEVKRAFIDPITDEDGSVVAEVNRIVDEVNEALSTDTLDTTAQTIIGAINELKAKITGSASGYTEITVTGASDIIAALNALQTAVTGLGTSKADASAVYAKSATYSKSEINSALYALEETVKEYADAGLSGKQATLTFDDAPTEDSANPVKSGGVFDAITEGLYLGLNTTNYKLYLYYADAEETYQLGDPIDFPLESVVVSGSYDSTNKKVVLTLVSGSTVEFSVADLVSGLVSANTAITGATKTKVTYDGKGLVTGGSDLEESDIPSLHLSKITDVTATAAEINKLAGLDTTATEFGYLHGVTSAIQTQINALIAAVNGKQATLEFDDTPTANSNNPVKSGGVKAALDTLNSAIPFKTISAPSSSTLTNDEKVAIVAGAYIAAYDDKLNLVFFPANQITGPTASQGWWYGTVIYSHPYAREYVGQYTIDTSNVLTIKSAFTITDGTVDIFNGKNIPSYPSSTGTFGFEIVNGTLSWVEKPVQSVEDYTIATSDWTALSSSSPYTYSATVTATHTIGNDTLIELINDQAVLFAKHGFAIGAVSGQSVTIYSIGIPDASVTLEVQYNG